MKYIKANLSNPGKELLLDSPSVRVLHAHLEKGTGIPAHTSKFEVVVVPIKGKILFMGDNHEGEVIEPGTIVKMEPGEIHELEALEDSDVIVTHII